MPKNLDFIYRRVAADQKAPVKVRLTALEELTQPSPTFLKNLLRSKKLPSELALRAAQMLEMLIAKQKLAKEAALESRATSAATSKQF